MTTSNIQRVFLVEDDHGTLNRLADIIRTQSSLSLVGMASTYTDAAKWLENNNLDVLLTDLGLPDGDGVDLIRDLRQWSAVPVIVLSARSQEADKIMALDAGADDYLVKPFGAGELMARYW